MAQRKHPANKRDRRDEPFDPAALAGAAVAAAISVHLSPGPYNFVSLAIGATLLSIIFAYENGRRRTFAQSAALATVSGLVALLPVGLSIELWLGHGNLDGALNEFRNARESRVDSWMLLVAWAVITGCILVFDLLRQFSSARTDGTAPDAAGSTS
jgi:hypothetical protein